MKLSHSKLSCILWCPMTYYLRYRLGMAQKTEKTALAVGSAVHWGLEHNTDDLSEYYNQSFNTRDNLTTDQCLAEAMVYGYLKIKDDIYKEILFDPDTGEQLKLVEEVHEIFIDGKLKSNVFEEPHIFVGIIDLLLLVENNKGEQFFIIIDYKTSSGVPDWNGYLEQIYRYIFLLRSEFPEVPVKKIGIINLRKATRMTKKSHENMIAYARRLKMEYNAFTPEYILTHMYNRSDLNDDVIDAYIQNLSKQADTAALIDINNTFYINFGGMIDKYGKTEFYDVFCRTKNAWVLYDIADKIWDADTGTFLTRRDCREIDMKVIDYNNVLNKYEQFKAQSLAYYSINEDINKESFFAFLKLSFITDDYLLERYWSTLLEDIKSDVKST